MCSSVSFSPAPACRSGEIPRYLAGWNALSPNHLRLVWNAARESAHESIRHVVLQLLQSLFPHLPKDQLDLVNGLARGLPEGEFDGRTLVLLKHPASASMKVLLYLEVFALLRCCRGWCGNRAICAVPACINIAILLSADFLA